MRRRMRCLWHNEKTASLVQQKNGWYCFGICRKLYSNAEVEAKTGGVYEYDDSEDFKEDLEQAYSYIDSLPRLRIRGFDLPADNNGYFIVWPNKAYYKYRRFSPGAGPKYIGAKGHRVPLFWARRTLK